MTDADRLDQELSRIFEARVANVEAPVGAADAARARAGRRQQRRHRITTVGASVAAVVALSITTWSVAAHTGGRTKEADAGSGFERDELSRSQETSQGGGGAIPRGAPSQISPWEPCPSAIAVPATDVMAGTAEVDAAVAPTLPDPAVAEPTKAWVCGERDGTPVVTFGDIAATYEPGWDEFDNDTVWRDEAASSQSGGEVVIVDGESALYSPEAFDGRASSLAMVRAGVMVIFYSYGADRDRDRLVELARSVSNNLG